MNHEINLDGLSVCLGIPSNRDIHPLVVKSLFATKDICQQHNIPCYLAMVAGNAIIQWARDEVVDLMLKTEANRFFFIDSDIVWKPEDFMRLLALSQVRAVVCASYPAKKDQPTYYVRYDDSKPVEADKYGLVEIHGAGLGFTVVTREIIEEISNASDTVRDEISEQEYASIFKVGVYNGNRRGEDMSFFEKLTDAGHKIYMDPSIELGHIGTKIYYGKILDAFRSSE